MTAIRATSRTLDADLDPKAFDGWQRTVAAVYAATLPPGTSFYLNDTSWQLPRGLLHSGRGSAVTLERDAALIASHPIDCISLFRLTRGKVVSTYDDRPATLRRGDLVFLDYALPIVSRSCAFACQSATVPRDRVPLRGRRGDLHGIVLQGASPLGRLLGRQLDALVAGMNDLEAGQIEAAFDNFVDYAVRFWPAPAGTFADTSLHDRAMAVIADALGDPALTPMLVAQRLKVSRAGLYAAFAQRNGIAVVIQQMRLDAALTMLVDERSTPGLVGAAAERWVFKSVAHFSRAFTERFGRAPTEVMAMSRDRVGGATFAEWLQRSGADPSVQAVRAWLEGSTKLGSERPPI